MNRLSSQQPETILQAIDLGMEYVTTDLLFSTKRDGRWVDTSKDEFNEKVRHFALGLYELGVGKGDRVAVHAENCTEWRIADLAVLSLGAVNVPLYTTQHGEQIKYILENSEAKVYIVSGDALYEPVNEYVQQVKNLQAVISIRESRDSAIRSFDAVLESGRVHEQQNPDRFAGMKEQVGGDDLASIIYTSGTTALPKGVMLTHGNIASNLHASLDRAPWDPETDRGLKMLSFLPLSHIFERMIQYMYLYMGYPVYFVETTEELVDDIKEVKPHFFVTVPRLLEKVYNGLRRRADEATGVKNKLMWWALRLADGYDPARFYKGWKGVQHRLADRLVYAKFREAFGGNLIGFISGGAALNPQLMKFFNGIGFYCGQGYGLTETSPVIAVTKPGDVRVGSVGKPLANVEVRIADDGEVETKGPHVMRGYYKMEKETREVLSDDGWFKTGDIGYLDNDGFLFITDRKKEIFKLSTGKYIAPQRIENDLVNSPLIEQAMVVGSDRKYCGALIVPNYEAVKERMQQHGRQVEPTQMDSDEKVVEMIQSEVDRVNAGLSAWETVKNFVIINVPFSIDSGELTPTMKIKRRIVHEKYADQIESLYQD